MNHTFKKYALSVFPKSFLQKLIDTRWKADNAKTKRVFASTTGSDQLLSLADLQSMQTQYKRSAEYGYSPEIKDNRGKQRSKRLLKLVSSPVNSTLELGCWDGMVSYHLKKRGINASGIDFKDEGFDRRALAGGTDLKKMDASALTFEDGSFDFVFSYDAFEHFENPTSVLSEMYRVLKPGGHMYLEFGPLYMAPRGLHAYRTITVPYCQFLFSKQTLEAFLSRNNMEPLDWKQCNGWTLVQFRDLWKTYSGRLKTLKYLELNDYRHLDLIREFPQIFKGQTKDYENLTGSAVEVLFRKDK